MDDPLDRGNAVRVSADSADGAGSAEAEAGRGEGGSSSASSLALPAVVEPAAGNDHVAEHDSSRTDQRQSQTRSVLDVGAQAAAGLDSYGAAVLRLVTDRPHREGMRLAVEICWEASVPERVLMAWFAWKTPSARKARLHGWRLGYCYFVENGLTASDMAACTNPAILVADFVVSLDLQQVKDYRIAEAKLAVQELFETIRPGSARVILESPVLRSIMISISAKVKRASRYLDIWPLGQLLDFIQRGPPSESLGYRDLAARTAAILMIFVPCRPVAMIRMDCSKWRWREQEGVLIVPAKEKTDRGRGWTELVVRRLDVAEFCPYRHLTLLLKRAAELGCVSAPFCSDRGVAYITSAPISRLLKRILLAAGIGAQYPAYSIRHALITALFDAGLSEAEVNAYTGHSNNAHVAATNYLHLNKSWIGRCIANRTLSERAKTMAARIMVLDNADKQREEMVEYGEDDADILDNLASASPSV